MFEDSILTFTRFAVSALYVSALMTLCIFGLHRLYLAIVFNRLKKREIIPNSYFVLLPKVTIQLPVYNEQFVVERLITSVCQLRYPKNLLQIQVLDDSTDETTKIAAQFVKEYKDRGYDITLIHRKNRNGYKAGALSQGLKEAKGDFIAIFDADFIPPSDFLTRTIHFFTDPSVGIVQARWGHVNRDYSLLTKAQAILLDGHFVIELYTRFMRGVFLNFNGTAGVIRKKCIESSGGWQHDTLTEDMDLSYRAQMRGWKIMYVKEVVSEAELPVDINAFKAQQHRWAKGGIQTATKLGKDLFKQKWLPLKVKLEAFFHLFGNLSYPTLLIVFFLMLPMGHIWSSMGWKKVFIGGVLAILAGTLSVFYFYLVAVKEAYGKDYLKHVKLIPFALAVGAGLTINNSKAVIEALIGKESEFRRTPKFGISSESKKQSWRYSNYVNSREITAIVELIVGFAFCIQTFYATYFGFVGWVPFLVMFQVGFIYIAILSMVHGRNRKNIGGFL